MTQWGGERGDSREQTGLSKKFCFPRNQTRFRPLVAAGFPSGRRRGGEPRPELFILMTFDLRAAALRAGSGPR
jgi:hypothetical protein